MVNWLGARTLKPEVLLLHGEQWALIASLDLEGGAQPWVNAAIGTDLH